MEFMLAVSETSFDDCSLWQQLELCRSVARKNIWKGPNFHFCKKRKNYNNAIIFLKKTIIWVGTWPLSLLSGCATVTVCLCVSYFVWHCTLSTWTKCRNWIKLLWTWQKSNQNLLWRIILAVYHRTCNELAGSVSL